MSQFKLTPVSSVTGQQYKNNWVIKNMMEAKSIGMLFGAPASAKSFIAMDLAFCVAAGIDWNGNKTIQGNAVYIAGEGFSGMGKRFKALESKYNTVTGNIYLSEMPAYLSDKASADIVYHEILRACPNPALIIIDTLHRNFGDGDENSSKDLAKFIFIISALVNATGATVLIVHHSGHGSSERARGSSSLKAAMDFEYKVDKSGSLVTMTCTKAKEFEGPPPVSFNLKTLPLPGWFDDEDKPVESAILEPSAYSPRTRQPSINEKDRLILQKLLNTINDTGQTAPASHVKDHPELADKKYALLDVWRKDVYSALSTDGTKMPTIRQAFLRSRDKLAKETKILVIDECCYCLE